MKELNEKLAEEVMGWSYRPSVWGGAWRDQKGNDPIGEYFDREGDAWQTLWNPTTDLNQLRECYLAAEKDWDEDAEGEGFESKFKRCLEPLIAKVCDRYTQPDALIVIAWVKHPELVAQAILKAKGVE